MKKFTLKKLISAVMAVVMVCGLAAASAGAVSTSDAVAELAYMNLEGASPELREEILNARAQIVYSKSWTVDPSARIIRRDGTVEKVPGFYDLFPADWDLKEITSITPDEPCDGVRTARDGSLLYHANVGLQPFNGTDAEPFYRFNASGNTVYAWAYMLAPQLNGAINIGFNNMDTGESIIWLVGVAKQEQVSIETEKNVRYGVRASATAGGNAGTAHMVVSEDPDVKISFKG